MTSAEIKSEVASLCAGHANEAVCVEVDEGSNQIFVIVHAEPGDVPAIIGDGGRRAKSIARVLQKKCAKKIYFTVEAAKNLNRKSSL